VAPAARTTAAPAAPAARPPAPAAPAARPPATPPAPAAAAGGALLTSDRLQLVGDGGRVLHVGVRTELGKHLARQFGADAEFWDARQCVLERLPSRQWQVAPLPGTTNETLVNGQALTAPRALRDGDVLAVGRQAKGVVKLPLTVRAL
jgi:pyruvate/2-oxoglutarate dehydrogenase complex dihydrolipoamide acyltransferase (E2) component